MKNKRCLLFVTIIFLIFLVGLLVFTDSYLSDFMSTEKLYTPPPGYTLPPAEYSTTPLVDYYKVAVTLKDVNLEYNNHVGNSWSKEFSVNNKAIETGSSYTIRNCTSSTTLNIKCEAFEDDKIPDYGYSTSSFRVDSLGSGKHNYYTDVIVRENRGRYSGNTACWRFLYFIEIIKEN